MTTGTDQPGKHSPSPSPADDQEFLDRLTAFATRDERYKLAADVVAEILANNSVASVTYEPERAAYRGALKFLEREVTCGDCIVGRCHWGGERSRESAAAAARGMPFDELCGCARHEYSVVVRQRRREHAQNGADDGGQ